MFGEVEMKRSRTGLDMIKNANAMILFELSFITAQMWGLQPEFRRSNLS